MQTALEAGAENFRRLVRGCISAWEVQGHSLVLQEAVEDVLETGSGERVGVPAPDHQVVDGPGAARGRREAVATVNLLHDLGKSDKNLR